MFRSVHGPTGLHSGYGSCVSYTSFLGYPYLSLLGRLARPDLLPGGSPLGSRGCLVPLSRVGDCSQPVEVQLLSVSGGPVSRGGHRRKDFYGFSIARSRLQAAVNRRRISVLRLASCQLVAVAAGDVVLSVSSGSRGPPADEIAPDLTSPLLGSVGSFGSCAVVSGLSSGPSVVASRGLPLSRGVSPSGIPRSGLLVRRFRRWLGGSLGRQGCFRPFGTSLRLFFQSMPGSCWQCVAVSSTSSPSVRDHGGSVLRQRHRGCLSAQGGGHLVSCSQHHCAGDPPLGRISSDSTGSPVHSVDLQCSRGLSLLSSSAPQLRVVSQHGRISIFDASVAGDDRPICHLRQSPLLHLFLALPRPSFGGDGRAPPVLGRSPGVHFSAVVHSSSGIGEASGVPPDPPHPHRPLLASASVVRGPPPVVGGSSSDSFCTARPPLPASVSSALPGSPQAGPSCLETIQRFTRAAGFSLAVAAQTSLARRPSSHSNYQLKWSVYRSWCRSQGQSISRPSLSKVADFLWWLRFVRGLSISSIKGYRSMLSVVFKFHLPALSSHPVLRDLLRSFRVSAPSYPMRPPSWDLSKVLRFLLFGAFEPLRDALLRALSKKVLFLLALATAKRVEGSSRRFHVLFPLLAVMPVSPMFRNSWPSLSRSLVPSLALSWSSPCWILWRAWMMTCFFALFVPFASISTGLCLWLRVGAAFSSLRAAPRAPCLRVRSPFSCVRSFMGLRRPVLRWVQSVPMTFVGSLPR